MSRRLLCVLSLVLVVGGCGGNAAGSPMKGTLIPDSNGAGGSGTGSAAHGSAGNTASAGRVSAAGSAAPAGMGASAGNTAMGASAGNTAMAGMNASAGNTASAGMSASSGNSGGGAGGAAAGSGAAGPSACPSYMPTSIVAIRNPPVASGCYELSHVGLVARTDSPTEPRIYVQDANGGDFSAILAKCAATATHVCPASVSAMIPQLFDTMQSGAQLTVRGYYQHGTVGGFEEFYIEALVDEGKMVTRPAPITLSVSDLARDARVAAKWFRRATVAIAAQDPLVMYDFSPADLRLATSAACPNYAGFAMIPKSAGTAATSGCTNATSPKGHATNPKEILIGRQYFNQFLFSSDCACMAGTNQRMLTPTSSVSGTVLGYLILEQDKNSTSPYQVFEPAADASFPIQ
jgi:hypothetical protein